MKYISAFIVILSIFCCDTAFGQYYEEGERGNSPVDNSRKDLYESKIESYSKLKRTGFTLATIGGGLTIAGVALVASVDWETVQNNNGTSFYTDDTKGLIGIYAILGGFPMLVTGIILERIGNKKVKEYSEKLYRLNLGIDYSQNYKGLTLTYRF